MSAPYPYTTIEEMEHVLSPLGVQLRGDDNDDGTIDPGVIEDCIDEATEWVNLYVSTRYSENSLNTSSWTRAITTRLACYLVSQRRGNPALFEAETERILNWLTMIKNGQLRIPRLPDRMNLIPSMSNYRVDDRFSINKTRVQPSISTGASYGKQDLDPNLPLI
jgi:phage gp36-like protein